MPFSTLPTREVQRRQAPGPGDATSLPCEFDDGLLRLYRGMAEQLPRGAVFVVDTDLRYLLATGPALRLSGFASGDFEGRMLSEALPPDLVAQHTEDCLAILAGGAVLREHCSGGVWYESHGLPLTDERGRIRAALVVSHDISKRRRQTERLQVLDRLGSVLAGASDANAIAGALARLLEEYFGPVRCEIASLDSEDAAVEIDGIALTRFGPDAVARLSSGELLASGDAFAARGLPVRSFLLCPHVAGGTLAGLTAILSGAPLAWSGEDRAFVCELSRRAWDHMDRLRLLDALQETDRRKDSFLAVLARELRNPLSVVRNSLALLGRPGTGVPPQAVLALIDRQCGHMNRLVEDALDTSIISYRPAALQCYHLDLQDAVLAAVEAARALMPAKSHTLSLSMTAQPIPVWVDPGRVAQALNNVLGNALKYSSASGRVEVAVVVERQDGQALVRITDNGIGMSPRTLAHLSALFGSDGDSAPPPAGALGVGLWVARRWIGAHGGSMQANSPGPDLGSTITITLPVHAVHWSIQQNK